MLDFTQSPSGYIAGLVVFAFAIGLVCGWGITRSASQTPRCWFDRNEPGPNGWWWEIYRCSNGSERREIVASPRG